MNRNSRSYLAHYLNDLIAEPLIQHQHFAIGFDKQLRGFIGLHDQPFERSPGSVSQAQWVRRETVLFIEPPAGKPTTEPGHAE